MSTADLNDLEEDDESDREEKIRILEDIDQFRRSAFRQAPERFRRDPTFVFVAVQKNGMILELVSEEFKGNREIVLAAVKQKGDALRYASDDLKHDREVVLEAVKECGWALFSASDDLKRDREIVIEAVKRNGVAIDCAPDDLRNDPAFVVLALESPDPPTDYEWPYEDFCGQELLEKIQRVKKLLLQNRELGMRDAAEERYINRWKRSIYERAWLVGKIAKQNAATFPTALIQKYAGIDAEYHLACDVASLAPLMRADARIPNRNSIFD